MRARLLAASRSNSITTLEGQQKRAILFLNIFIAQSFNKAFVDAGPIGETWGIRNAQPTAPIECIKHLYFSQQILIRQHASK